MSVEAATSGPDVCDHASAVRSERTQPPGTMARPLLPQAKLPRPEAQCAPKSPSYTLRHVLFMRVFQGHGCIRARARET